MSVFFYNIFLLFFNAGIHIASLFNNKAMKWVGGRKNIFQKLERTIPKTGSIVWVHCASLGEFEQGRPLIEQLKQHYPEQKILLTFFSPSGFEVQKEYKIADWVFYLPSDGPQNAKRFLEIVHPSLVIFVKYEFWFYYLKKIKYRDIPLLLVSALFRRDMSFFKWYGGLQRKMLSRFDHLFVQNEESKRLIDSIGLGNICSISGDTRFDRVIGIAEKSEAIPAIEKFISSAKVIIAGSTWKEDEQLFQQAFSTNAFPSLKLIIAPHEITDEHLSELKLMFPRSRLFADLGNEVASPNVDDGRESKVLIIDNIGMLSRLYRYAFITYVGGGQKKLGVHNVLEAAVYGKPVMIGPYYHKYVEAVGLVKSGGALVIKDAFTTKETISKLIANQDGCYDKACAASKNFVWKNKGATNKIIQFIQEKRLLTN